jgi:3-hydroxyacyl-CoA dehydrogenase
VAIIGAGQMGSSIACLFANAGLEVLLLDIAPKSLTEKEKHANKTLSDTEVKNRIVNTSLKKVVGSKPSPLYLQEFQERIQTGNLDDHLHLIENFDWILEVVNEKLSVKKEVFRQIEKFRTPETPITTNTSGFSIDELAKGESKGFQECFFGTHFFNPPRYLRLVEIVPHSKTNKKWPIFFKNFLEKYLGKKAVIAKNTPAFIGNRIATFSFMNIAHLLEQLDLSIEQVDELTGELIGRPKSATFRTADLVGLDTLTSVSAYLKEQLPENDFHTYFQLPGFLKKMLQHKLLGQKTNYKGFYKKVKDQKGKSSIFTLDLNTLEYRDFKKADFEVLAEAKKITDLKQRIQFLLQGESQANDFLRKMIANLLGYSSHCLPEIVDDIYQIDEALKAGFAWQHGPFELWDAIGFQEGLRLMKRENVKPADWIFKLKKQDCPSFYKVEHQKINYFVPVENKFKPIPGQEKTLNLNAFGKSNSVYKNPDIEAVDLGDGILNVEFKSKMNIFNENVLNGMNEIFDLAEERFQGMTFYNRGKNFSVGADLKAIYELAASKDFEKLDEAVRYFQQTMMRLRYSTIPTVAAPHQMTLGGGCELCLHADQVVAHAELYMGLVEFGIGLIPGGGGTKELALRTSASFRKGDVELNRLREKFLEIAMAKVSTSAYEAKQNELLSSKNTICIQRDNQLTIAKKQALLLAKNGYLPPIKHKNIKVLGRQALGAFYVGTNQMRAGNYISDHDHKIANQLAYVIAGGDLSEPRYVSENYLLDLEREAFLSLAGEQKTLDRMKAMLTTGKALRN